MPLNIAETPSRAKYDGSKTVAQSPNLVTSQRCELRAALAALNESSDSESTTLEAREIPSWPSGRPTKPRSPVLSTSQRGQATAGNLDSEENIPLHEPDVTDIEWPLSHRTRPRSPSLLTSRRSTRFQDSVGQSTRPPLQRNASSTSTWPATGLTRPRPPSLSIPRVRNSTGTPPAHRSSIATAGRASDIENRGSTNAEGQWSGLPTRPRAPQLSAARTRRSQSVAEFGPSGPSQKRSGRILSKADRDAAFARLTRPKAPAGLTIANPQANRDSAFARPVLSKEERDAAFARLTKPRRPPSVPQKDDEAQQGAKALVSSHFSGRPATVSDISSSAGNPTSLEASFGSTPPVLQSREVNVQYPATGLRTVPKPFALKSVELHESAKVRLSERVRAEEIELAKRRSFKAAPLALDLLQGPTFVPKLPPATEVCTVPEQFPGHSEERAKSRAAFDEENQDRIARENEERKAREAARALAEQIAAKKEWRSRAFRARDVPDFAAIEQAQKEAAAAVPPFEPTSPHTPFLATKMRSLGTAVTPESGRPSPPSNSALRFDTATEDSSEDPLDFPQEFHEALTSPQ